ncbi:hypothetical protein CK203_114171 [Vitis vinifera]|uniref:Uncharacterized protein n=1 Tax=Vitis vinifera TaxID=29760 RepID=A0A438CBH0_VITVI|nr:hypothetical protein CK203_114171 [Vitis vinifera]
MLPQPPIEETWIVELGIPFRACFDLAAFRPFSILKRRFTKEASESRLHSPPLPKAAMPNFGASGIPSEPQLERKRICREPFTLDKWNNMTAYKVDQPGQPQPAARRASPRHIPEPSTSAEPRMAIPISEYRELCRALETLTASQSNLAQEMAAIRACQEQMLASQAQQAAILRQLQVHFDLPQAVEPSTDTPQSHTLILQIKTEESYEESWAKLRSHLPRVNPDCKEKKQRESAIKHILDDSRSQQSNASNGVQFGVETKKLQPLQANHSELKEAFCKVLQITLLLRSDFAAFLYSKVFLLLTMHDLCREKEAGTSRWKPTSQPCEDSLVLRNISQPS